MTGARTHMKMSISKPLWFWLLEIELPRAVWSSWDVQLEFHKHELIDQPDTLTAGAGKLSKNKIYIKNFFDVFIYF